MWIIDLFTGKKDTSKEVYADRDSIIPEYLKKASMTEMETAEEDLHNDWTSRVHNVSDFVLAEEITELELAGKGAPENFNAHWQEVMGDVRKNRAKAEERLLKLVPRHSQLDVQSFFERIKKQNDKLEVAKARGKTKKSDLSFTSADTLAAKGTSYKVSVLESDADANVYVVKTASGVNYYGSGDAHETFEKAVIGLEKEATKAVESGSIYELEAKDAAGAWKKVTSSYLLKDLQIRAEYLTETTPGIELRVQALTEPLFHEGETVGSASGHENAEILQVDKDNGMYVMKIPGFPTPVRYTFEKAHAGYHPEEKEYLGKKPQHPGLGTTEPREMGKPGDIPPAKSDYISTEERAKLVKTRKELEEVRKELESAPQYSRQQQDLSKRLKTLEEQEASLSDDKLLTPKGPTEPESGEKEKKHLEELNELNKLHDAHDAAVAAGDKDKANAISTQIKDLEMARDTRSENVLEEKKGPSSAPAVPQAHHKMPKEPEPWSGWENTERVLKPLKHKKTNQGFDLSLTANSLTLSLPNGSFLTSVHANEQEASAEFDKAGDLDSLALLFPIAILEAAVSSSEEHHKNCPARVSGNPDECSCADVLRGEVEKKLSGPHTEASLKTAEDVGTGGPNMDGSNVMVDPQRGGINQMGMGVEENPKPFKKESEEDPIEAQLMADMDELVEGAGGAEAVIAKAMEAGAKSREEIAGQAVKALVSGPTHEVDFESQLSAKGPNSSAQAEPDWEHHNQKFTLAECVPAMERALDEFLPEKKTSEKLIPNVTDPKDIHHRSCPEYYKKGAGCNCAKLEEADEAIESGKRDAEKPYNEASLDSQTFVVGENVILNATVGALSEGTEVRITGVVGSSLAFEAVHDSKIIGITKFAKVDKQTPLEKYQWDNDGIKVAFEIDDHVKVASATFLNGKDLKGREGTIREKIIFSSPDAEVNMFYLVEFDGAESTTLPGDCLKRGSTKKASFLDLSRTAAEKEYWCTTCGHALKKEDVTEHYDKGHHIDLVDKTAALGVVSIIVKGPKGWSVKSHDGKKNLGGPYGSREKAERRLAQVEMFKNMKGASVDKKPWLVPEGTPEPPESTEFAASRARFLRDKEIEELKKQKGEIKQPSFPAVDKSSAIEGVKCDECTSVCGSCDFCGCYHSDEGKCMNAMSRQHIREQDAKRREGTHQETTQADDYIASLKTAVMKPNMDTAQAFLDSFKIPPTVVSDIMIQEFLQKENLHASKTDLSEIYKILQSSGVEVRINIPKEQAPAPVAAPAIPPKKKSSFGDTLTDITDALNTFHASAEYKSMLDGTHPQVKEADSKTVIVIAPSQEIESAKEDPTDVDEANGIKVGSKVQYTVKHEDELADVRPGTTITGRVILMPVQHPEKDPVTGQAQGAASPTATVMWDKEELGTMAGLLPEELVKIATWDPTMPAPDTGEGLECKNCSHPESSHTTQLGRVPWCTAEAKDDDGNIIGPCPCNRFESSGKWIRTAGTKYTSEVTAPDGSKTVVEKEMEQDMGDVVKVKNPDGTEVEYKKSSLTVEAKGENAKIRDLKKRLEKENKPAEITALINAIDALSGYVSKGKEAREKRRQDKASKAPAEPTPETAEADKAEVLAEATPSNLGEPNAGGDGMVADDESAQAAESPRGTIEVTPEPMGDLVQPLKVETKEDCCIPTEPGFHNDNCPEHIEWLKSQKPAGQVVE